MLAVLASGCSICYNPVSFNIKSTDFPPPKKIYIYYCIIAAEIILVTAGREGAESLMFSLLKNKKKAFSH